MEQKSECMWEAEGIGGGRMPWTNGRKGKLQNNQWTGRMGNVWQEVGKEGKNWSRETNT